jgi:Rod binding domain-containing protein
MDITQDASLATKKAQESELIALRQQMDRLKGDLMPTQNKQQKLRKACVDFEAVFVGKLWEQMRATIPKNDPLHSPQEDMYRSMFDHDFSEKLASDGGIGLGDMLYQQLKDKLNNTTKIPGKTGLNTLAAAVGRADSEAAEKAAKSGVPQKKPGTLKNTGVHFKPAASGLVESRVFKGPSRPMGSGGKTFTGTEAQESGTGDSAADARGIPMSQRQADSSSASSVVLSETASGSASAGAFKHTAASDVVSPDVEALAQRIEAEYDHRLLVNGIKPSQVRAYGQSDPLPTTKAGRKLAEIG